MPFSIAAFVSYLLLILGASCAQISAPNCTDTTLAWSFNSLLQNPCMVAAYLEAVCSDGTFHVPALPLEQSYAGPRGVNESNPCICSVVVYNLISACGACQQAPWISYSAWSENCTTTVTAGGFPESVPVGTQVPVWAYLVPLIDDTWNLTVAKTVGNSAEVTGTATFSPIASGSESSSTSTAYGSLNRGGIEGGIVGGVVGGTLISGLVIWFVRRRRTRYVPSTTDTWGEIEQPVPDTDSLTIETPRLYDPLDPTTYPRREFQPQRFGFTSLRSSQLEYSGLPEV